MFDEILLNFSMRSGAEEFFSFFSRGAVQKSQGAECVNLVNLGKSFQTSIYLQNLALIQPRTSLLKFADN